MKLIMAIVKPFKLDEVRESLVAAGVEGRGERGVRVEGRDGGLDQTGRHLGPRLPDPEPQAGHGAAVAQDGGGVADLEDLVNTGFGDVE